MASTVGHLWANVTFARQPFDGLPAGSGCCTTLYPDFHSFTFAHSNQAPGTHADHQPVGRTAAALQPDPARTWPASILAELHGVPWRQRPGADRRIPPPVWLGCQLLGTRLPWRQGRGQRLPGAAYSAGHYFLERRPAALPQRTGAIRIFKEAPTRPRTRALCPTATIGRSRRTCWTKTEDYQKERCWGWGSDIVGRLERSNVPTFSYQFTSLARP